MMDRSRPSLMFGTHSMSFIGFSPGLSVGPVRRRRGFYRGPASRAAPQKGPSFRPV
jgi:hypothetical protein